MFENAAVDDEMLKAGRAALAHLDRVEDRVAEMAGVVNAAHGELVSMVGEALDAQLWQGVGLHSPGQWLAWRTGVAPSRAGQIVRIAKRRRELPCAVRALVAGELSVDQVHVIARHVPAEFDESVTELARLATVAQLKRILPRYQWHERDEDAPPVDEDEKRRASLTYDESGEHGRLRATMPADEAAVIETALKAAIEDRFRQESEDLPAGAPRPMIGTVDGLLALAESYLAHGQAVHPNSDRFVIYAHLEADPTHKNLLGLHLGPVLPSNLRRLNTCDATIRPVWESNGVPVNVGRDQRIVPRKVRRLIEHRDGGCSVPGCGRTRGLEVHHIVHWEDGGVTDTHNLLTLCRRHHRAHHLGLLGIDGDPNHPNGPRPLCFSDRNGRRIEPLGRPEPPPSPDPVAAASQRRLPAADYAHPLGERMRAAWVILQPADEHPTVTDAPERAGPA